MSENKATLTVEIDLDSLATYSDGSINTVAIEQLEELREDLLTVGKQRAKAAEKELDVTDDGSPFSSDTIRKILQFEAEQVVMVTKMKLIDRELERRNPEPELTISDLLDALMGR